MGKSKIGRASDRDEKLVSSANMPHDTWKRKQAAKARADADKQAKENPGTYDIQGEQGKQSTK